MTVTIQQQIKQMNTDRFKYSNYSGARSQNKKESCFG